MRILLLIIPIFIFAFDFKQEYLNKNFEKICKYGVYHIKEIKNNDDLLSLVGFSCIKSDNIIYLPAIVNLLKNSKKARLNSIYFSIIFLEKKLLISYVLDGIDISYYRFPLTDYPLSIVINNIINKTFKKENNLIIISYKNKIYKVYKSKDNKVFIDVYQNNQLIQSHWYK